MFLHRNVGTGFQPSVLVTSAHLGRCPRLVWRRAVGAELKACQAKPRRLRSPHSATKQASANRNTLAWCHRGDVQLSVTGAFRSGSPLAKDSSLLIEMTSPPVFLAMASSKARLGLSER